MIKREKNEKYIKKCHYCNIIFAVPIFTTNKQNKTNFFRAASQKAKATYTYILLTYKWLYYSNLLDIFSCLPFYIM